MRIKYLLFILLALPFLSGCNDDDDVLGIFTDHTWRLTNIFEKGKPENPYTGFWNESEYEAYVKALNKSDNFTINFEGIEKSGVASGAFSGYATNSDVSGEWHAEASSNKMGIDVKRSSNKDAAGREFIEGLKNAHSYDGDYHNLRIHYKKNGREFYLLFHNPNKK